MCVCIHFFPSAPTSTVTSSPKTTTIDTSASALEELSDDEDLLSQAEQLEASKPQVFISPGSRDALVLSQSKGSYYTYISAAVCKSNTYNHSKGQYRNITICSQCSPVLCLSEMGLAQCLSAGFFRNSKTSH